jgi:uncharacterized protein (TIGR02421 family)
MPEVVQLTDAEIKKLVKEVLEGRPTRASLPGGGKLNVEKSFPYIMVYRRKDRSTDQAMIKLLLSEASYLVIGNKDFRSYQKLVQHLGEKMSVVHKSYLFMELWEGPKHSKKFYIKGPADRIPATMETLRDELLQMEDYYDRLKLGCEIENTTERHPRGKARLLSLAKIKRAGFLLLGLEVPPVYKSTQGKVFPVFFRSFHDRLVHALHKCFFDFIRVQTVFGVANYSALGRATIDQQAYEIDKKLCELERQFDFLWLVSPSNIAQIKKRFFDSKYQKVINYHYRLLPIDPDLIKRELYNLRIEAIEDPSISFLYLDKREELDRQITMLTERGTKNFLYSSIRLYQGVGKKLLQSAQEILEQVEETAETDSDDYLDATAFADLAHQEFGHLRRQHNDFDCKIHLRKDVNILMVSHGELYVPEDFTVPAPEAEALVQHEVGTHVVTYFNGRQQALQQLAYGLADYEALQEGLAVMAEYLTGGLSANRMRTLAARVVAGDALVNGADFQEIFSLLTDTYGLSTDRAFNVTSRIMQGGGFLKDIIYLKGLVELCEYVRAGGEITPLFTGKIAVKHINVVKALKERGLLKEPALMPTYLQREHTSKRFNKIREGLPLPQMVNA